MHDFVPTSNDGEAVAALHAALAVGLTTQKLLTLHQFGRDLCGVEARHAGHWSGPVAVRFSTADAAAQAVRVLHAHFLLPLECECGTCRACRKSRLSQSVTQSAEH